MCRRRCGPYRRLADAARGAKRVCDSYTPWRRLRRACRSVRWLSMMTPSDFISGLTGRGLLATSTVVTAATDLSWVAVPSVITSDLSAFNCRWFHKNHRLRQNSESVARERTYDCQLPWQRGDASRRRNDDETHRTSLSAH